ncbi:MAG: hypothetical protein ACLPJH_11240 [Myxococcaceae bacterium]
MRRGVRILTVLVGLLTAFVVLLLAMLWRGPLEVRAHAFTLLNNEGRPAALLQSGEDGPALTLFEPGGLVVLGGIKGDIGLGVVSSNGEHVIHLLVGRDGVPALNLSSSRGELGIGVSGQRPAILFKTDDKMRLAITDDSLRTFNGSGQSSNLLSAIRVAVDGGP